MNGHVSSLSQRFAYFPHRLRGISPRGRHTSVLHWERQEEEPARLSKVRLRTKLQVFVFLRCEKRNHGIHSGFSPIRDLVFQPVAPTGPRRDCELARPGAVNPIELRVHSSYPSADSSLFSHDYLARKRVHIDSSGSQNLEVVVPIQDRAVGSRLESIFLSWQEALLRISVEIRLNWYIFDATSELSGCRGFRGGFATELYSERRSANFRVAVRPS